MDFGDGWQNFALLAVVAVFFVVSIFFRRRKGESSPMVIAMTLLRDVDKNQKLVQSFHFNWKTKKFKVANWQKYNDKLAFLGEDNEELKKVMSTAFMMAVDFNEKIEEAKKHKSSSYLATVQVDRLSVPLAKSREGLEQWVQENWSRPEMFPKRRGFLG